MSERSKTTVKKKRSQIPVALVYFATMLLFLAMFGLIASFLVNRLEELNQPAEPEPVPVVPTTNMLFAKVNTKNVLTDMAIIRIAPEKNSVVVIPVSSFTLTNEGKTLRETYNDDGIKEVKSSLEELMNLQVDNYLTVSNKAFEKIADLLGGVVYTPSEELYYLAENDADDISLRKGQTVSLVGRQIRLLFQYPVFSEGKSGNLEFMGTALDSLVKSFFKQSSITANNLDNIYNILTEDSDTDFDKNAYKTQKKYIKQMLDTNAVSCKLLIPSGTWSDDKLTLSEDFKDQLAKLVAQTEPASSSAESE